MNELRDLFIENQKQLLVYLGIESKLDPYEDNTSVEYMNPLVINALVSDLTATKMTYAMPGIISDRAREITIEKRYRDTLELSQKLRIKGEDEYYAGWRVNGKMQIREEGEYLRLYIYLIKSDAD